MIWSYSMKDHWSDRHGGEALPIMLAQEVALRYHEKEGTAQLLSKRSAKNVKVACQGPACACKKDLALCDGWTEPMD